jgi:hypothetical protein
LDRRFARWMRAREPLEGAGFWRAAGSWGRSYANFGGHEAAAEAGDEVAVDEGVEADCGAASSGLRRQRWQRALTPPPRRRHLNRRPSRRGSVLERRSRAAARALRAFECTWCRSRAVAQTPMTMDKIGGS